MCILPLQGPSLLIAGVWQKFLISLVEKERVRTELFFQTGYQGRKRHRSFYYYKNWDPQARVALIFLQLLFLLTARATVSVLPE